MTLKYNISRVFGLAKKHQTFRDSIAFQDYIGLFKKDITISTVI